MYKRLTAEENKKKPLSQKEKGLPTFYQLVRRGSVWGEGGGIALHLFLINSLLHF